MRVAESEPCASVLEAVGSGERGLYAHRHHVEGTLAAIWAGRRQNLTAGPVQRERRPWLLLPVEAMGSSKEGQPMRWFTCLDPARTSSCFHPIEEKKLVCAGGSSDSGAGGAKAEVPGLGVSTALLPGLQ